MTDSVTFSGTQDPNQNPKQGDQPTQDQPQSQPQPQPQPDPGNQDQLLLGKFKSVEDLQRAYIELQQKLGQGPQNKPVQEPTKSPSVADLIRTASGEFAARGSLSPETQSALEKVGVGQDIIQAVLAGEQARRSQQAQEIMGAAGGSENFAQVKAWAEENLDDAEIEAFNNVIQSGNLAAAKLAVQGLVARMRGAVPNAPRPVAGKPASGPHLKPFHSQQELVQAMADPRYEQGDPAYHDELMKRISISTDLLGSIHSVK